MKLLAAHDARFLWIASDQENQRRVIPALRDFGFPNATIDLLAGPDAMLRMGVPPLRLEVLKSIAGVEFEDCWTRRIVLNDGDLSIPMISLADLKQNKRAAGRTKDQLDLEELP